MQTTGTCLVNKACIPCQGGVPPLPAEEVQKLLKEVGKNWILNQEGHLYKEYTFKDFKSTMNFANKVAEISEKEGHHPDLRIAWGKCAIEIWTHKIGGLTESDFILGAKIEAIL